MNNNSHPILIKIIRLSALLVVALALAGTHPERIEAVRYMPLSDENYYHTAKDFAIVRKGAMWHVYAIWCNWTLPNYTPDPNCQSPYLGLRHLTSTDLTHWIEVGYVIPPGSPGAWDDGQIWAPSVVERNGVYYMFYAGTKDLGTPDPNVDNQKIGLATSTDLYTWTKYTDNPVVDCGDEQYTNPALGGTLSYHAGTSDAQCRDPNVNWDEDREQWVMTFSAVANVNGSAEPWLSQPAAVAMATSTDLHTWTFAGDIYASYTVINAESSHVFKHGDTYYMGMTDNGGSCSSGCILPKVNGNHPDRLGQYLVLFSSSDRYTGWGTSTYKYRVKFPDVGPIDFASEYVENRGKEYYAGAGTGLLFKLMTWNGSPFHLVEIPYGGVSGTVWDDADTDGIKDGGEAGIAGVTLTLYLGTENVNHFDAASDMIYAVATTAADGTYSFSSVLPDTYYVSVDPSNAAVGNPLSGMAVTVGGYAKQVTVASGTTLNNQHIGAASAGNSWTFPSGSDYRASAGVAVSDGRVGSTVFSGTTETIEPLTSVPFARLTDFRASTIDNGGSVTFVLSNDDGAAWQYWNGSQWAASNGSVAQSNTAAEMTAYAGSFPDGGRQLKWRALLYAPVGSNPLLLHVGSTSNRAPATPTLISPANGAVYGDGRPQFQISSSDPEANPMIYELQLDASPDFNTAARQTFNQTTMQLGWSGQSDSLERTRYTDAATAAYTPIRKVAPGTWYWRVRTADPEGSGKYSAYAATRSFIVPPVTSLSSFVAQPVGSSSLNVSWTSSSAATGFVEYGASTAYGSMAQEASATTAHAVLLTGLTPNIVYHLRARMTDAYEQTSLSGDYAITIPSTVISGVSIRTTATTATVRWTTNEPSSAVVEYGTTKPYSKTARVSGYRTAHTVVIRGLSPHKKYHCRIRSIGSTAAITADRAFTTDRTPVAPPKLASVTAAQSTPPVIRVVGSGPAGHAIRLYVDGKFKKKLSLSGRTGLKAFSIGFGVPRLKPGKHTLTAVAENAAGRRSAPSNKYYFTVGLR